MITYDTIVQILRTATTDPDFVRKNSIMQNSTTALEIQNRITALTPDVNLSLDYSNVQSSLGDLQANGTSREIVFDPQSKFALSSYKDGIVSSPGKLFSRVTPGSESPSDNIRYLLADSVKGVILLDQYLTPVSVFPNFTSGPATDAPDHLYSSPVAAITFYYGGVEYIAIAMGGTNVAIHVYNFQTAAWAYTIGVPNVAGVPPVGLGTLTALAWRAQDSKLYIACSTGQPAGATSSTGFIASYSPATSTLAVTGSLYTVTDGSLLHREVSGPKCLLSDDDRLWIVNGDDEIALIDPVTTLIKKFIPANGYTYNLLNVRDIHIKAENSLTNAPTPAALESEAVFPITTFIPSDDFQATVQGGAIQTLTLQATRATVVGLAATYAAVLPGDKLDLQINGVTGTVSVTFTGLENTQSAYLLAINAALFRASAIDNLGQVQIQTDAFGSNAGGYVMSTSSASVLLALGLSVGPFNNPGPNNVSDISSVTLTELAGLFNANFLGTTSIATSLNTLLGTSNLIGAASSLQFVAGTGVAKVAGLDLDLHVGSNAGTVTFPTSKVLYVANSSYGNIVLFSVNTGIKITSYGIRQTQDNLVSTSPYFFASAGSVDGILPDLVSDENTIIVADSTNKRLIRLDEDSYKRNNCVTFKAQSFVVPLSLQGYSLAGDIPQEMVTVEYRAYATDTWHVLSPVSQIPPLTFAQFRLSVVALQDRAVKKLTISKLTILAEQS